MVFLFVDGNLGKLISFMNAYGNICFSLLFSSCSFYSGLVWHCEVLFQMWAYNKAFQNNTLFQYVEENNYFLHAVI